MRNFSIDQRFERASVRVAIVMRGMWEEKSSSDTRLLLPPLIPDEFVTVGVSLEGSEHSEHVVPRKVICDECHKLIENGATNEEVAAFIRKHLKIVRISKEEQRRLDKSVHFNLRQKMPIGWGIGDDVYDRLKAAGITFKLSDLS